MQNSGSTSKISVKTEVVLTIHYTVVVIHAKVWYPSFMRSIVSVWVLAPVLVLFTLVFQASSPVQAGESRVYITSVPDAETFEPYTRIVGSDRLGKFVIDLQTNQILFFDVNLYRMHDDFVFKVLYQRPLTQESLVEYNRNYDADKPRFILGYLVHHLKTGDFTFAFWDGDKIRAADVRKVYHRLLETFFRKDIKFRPESPEQEQLLTELQDMPTITNDRIYKSASFQTLNPGTAIGVLRVVPVGTPYEQITFQHQDIVILQESYPDISPVSGILSTNFSTPLAHVNLRAKAWNIPNAGLKDAVEKYAKLDGKIVSLQVTETDLELRAATQDEIQMWKHAQTEARVVRVPVANLRVTELRPLEKMSAQDAKIYGTKAANLGVIVSAEIPGVNVPDGFGIPFSFYQAHMKKHHLDRKRDRILNDPRFRKDPEWRKQALAELRAQIVAAPINSTLLSAVSKKIIQEWGGKGVFVRSSTNAEDLEGFNGAGLYETVPNVMGEKALGQAIKIVWASLWNYHAVEERTFFGIDHRACYAGVLIQVGVNATAAGVLITKNVYDSEDRKSFTINAKHGLGLRVVGGKDVPEQILYDPTNQGTKIISRSDDPVMLVFDEKGGVRELPNLNKSTILTQARARALASVVQALVPLFPPTKPLDIEWVLEGELVWIVQSRPYVSKN